MTSETVFYTDFSHMCEHARRQYGPFPDLIIYPPKTDEDLIPFKHHGKLVAMWDLNRELGYILADR